MVMNPLPEFRELAVPSPGPYPLVFESPDMLRGLRLSTLVMNPRHGPISSRLRCTGKVDDGPATAERVPRVPNVVPGPAYDQLALI